MATSVTSFVDVTDDRNAPSPKYYTSPNTWIDMMQLSTANTFNITDVQGNGMRYRTASSLAEIFNNPVKMSDDETVAGCMFGQGDFDTMVPCTANSNYNIQFVKQYANSFKNFNSEVIIGKNVITCECMFFAAINYNHSTIIPNKVKSVSRMFYNAASYNQPTTIPNNVTNCSMMFVDAIKYNQPTTIPNNVTNCYQMFSGTGMNAPVVIGQNVTNCAYMFGRTSTAQHQTIMNVDDMYIPASVENAYMMFNYCGSKPKNIYINLVGRTKDINLCGMFYLTPSSHRVNVYCSQLNRVNGISTNQNNSLFNGQVGRYDTVVNGMANLQYNVYLYYNYNG